MKWQYQKQTSCENNRSNERKAEVFDDIEKLKDFALRKLSFRMRTELEMRNFLEEKTSSSKDVEAVIEFLKEYEFLSDKKYSIEYYRYHKLKDKADTRIIRELYTKGIDKTVAEEAIKSFKEEVSFDNNMGDEYVFGLDNTRDDEKYTLDEKTIALRVGEKILKNHLLQGKEADGKLWAKVGRRLAGLGYSSNICYFVIGKLKNLWKEYGDEI